MPMDWRSLQPGSSSQGAAGTSQNVPGANPNYVQGNVQGQWPMQGQMSNTFGHPPYRPQNPVGNQTASYAPGYPIMPGAGAQPQNFSQSNQAPYGTGQSPGSGAGAQSSMFQGMQYRQQSPQVPSQQSAQVAMPGQQIMFQGPLTPTQPFSQSPNQQASWTLPTTPPTPNTPSQASYSWPYSYASIYYPDAQGYPNMQAHLDFLVPKHLPPGGFSTFDQNALIEILSPLSPYKIELLRQHFQLQTNGDLGTDLHNALQGINARDRVSVTFIGLALGPCNYDLWLLRNVHIRSVNLVIYT
jgi:hypothetical protein